MTIDKARPLTDRERSLVERLFSNPLLLPVSFKQWLINYLGPEIQVSQSQVTSNGLTLSDGTDVVIGGGTGSRLGQLASKLGFFGAAPVAKPSAYTQTYATADKTLNPASTAAFTGQNNAVGGNTYAKFSDIEQLRQDLLDGLQTLNAVIDDLQSLGLLS